MNTTANFDDEFDARAEYDDDADTASQRSISLSSPAVSNRNSKAEPSSPLKRESHPYTVSTDASSERDDTSLWTRPSSVTSAAPSTFGADETVTNLSSLGMEKSPPAVVYPPPPLSAGMQSDASFETTTSYSKKARPESMLVQAPKGPLVLGIALVDFNHQVGPRIEFSKGDIFDDEEISTILPFVALPDGAHLSAEDYCYFHLVPASPNPTTVFGISCNRQIATSSLLVKEDDMTRSTVQKAVVVLCSKPLFGPIRDRLGVVTMALFEQKDFTETGILVDFYDSLEHSLRSQLTESGLYMGTSLRELVHQFRQRTLVLLKALILQKKIMFYGHPVETLCTYQYSLTSLIPGLLQALDDSGSPPLASRAKTLSRPNSLRTSDRKSLMAYLGLPLDLFGKDAFFQPYLPLQQLDIIKGQMTKSFLCGSTNSIVTQQKDVEVLVNIESGVLEFKDREGKLERTVGLTAADRKWMDEIVREVNEGWEEEEAGRGMQRFKGSDDYLRIKFEEYISAALASVKYADFLAKGENSGVLITPGSGADSSSIADFNPVWIAEFKRTNAYEVWQRVTDPMLFDIVEPRHPCNERPSAIADISLRLSEGIQELKLDQQLAPTREAISRTFNAGSTGFFKAVEGVRGRWMQRGTSSTSVNSDGSATSKSPTATPAILASPAMDEMADSGTREVKEPATPTASTGSASRPPSVTADQAKERLTSWGSGIGSFFSARAPRFSVSKGNPPPPSAPASAQSPTTPIAQSPTSFTSTRGVVSVLESPDAEEDRVMTMTSPVSSSRSFDSELKGDGGNVVVSPGTSILESERSSLAERVEVDVIPTPGLASLSTAAPVTVTVPPSTSTSSPPPSRMPTFETDRDSHLESEAEEEHVEEEHGEEKVEDEHEHGHGHEHEKPEVKVGIPNRSLEKDEVDTVSHSDMTSDVEGDDAYDAYDAVVDETPSSKVYHEEPEESKADHQDSEHEDEYEHDHDHADHDHDHHDHTSDQEHDDHDYEARTGTSGSQRSSIIALSTSSRLRNDDDGSDYGGHGQGAGDFGVAL